MDAAERVVAQDQGTGVLCVRCEAERDGNPTLSKSLRCAGACKEEKELRAFPPAVVRELLPRRWHRWKDEYVCQVCAYPVCAMCEAERPGKELPVLMYPPDASEYHEGKYICPTHRYPPCPGCGTPRPCREDGRGRVEYDVFHKPEWSCSACLKKGPEQMRCMECEEQKNVDEFAPYFKDCWKNVESWRCLACQYPVCARCGVRRSETVAPTRHEAAYRCERCRQTYRCAKCGEEKHEDDYDQAHFEKSKYYGRSLVCLACQTKGYYCNREGCKAMFPRSHFDKRDLYKVQQGRKKEDRLMCRR